jgi:hypothetical protein
LRKGDYRNIDWVLIRSAYIAQCQWALNFRNVKFWSAHAFQWRLFLHDNQCRYLKSVPLLNMSLTSRRRSIILCRSFDSFPPQLYRKRTIITQSSRNIIYSKPPACIVVSHSKRYNMSGRSCIGFTIQNIASVLYWANIKILLRPCDSRAAL